MLGKRWTGADVYKFRQQYHLTKTQLAKLINRHARTIAEWERLPPKPLTAVVSRALDLISAREEDNIVQFREAVKNFSDERLEASEYGSISGRKLYDEFNSWLGREYNPFSFARYYRLTFGPFKYSTQVSGIRLKLEDEAPPKIPDQVIGMRFEPGLDGRLTLARGSPLSESERGRLAGLHEMILEAANELLGKIKSSNGYATLQRPTERYLQALQRSAADLMEGDIEILYGCGLSLQAARETLSHEIERGDAPPEDIRLSGPLQQVLGLHGPFLQSTKRGIELYDQTDRDRRTRADDLDLKHRQIALNNQLSRSTILIAEDAQEAIEAVTDTMASSANEERANAVGRRAIRNLLAGLARIAASRRAWTTAAGVLATEAVINSKSGVALLAGGSAAVDTLIGSGGQVVAAAQAFIVQNAPLIKAVADAGGPSFTWVAPFIDWIRHRVDHNY